MYKLHNRDKACAFTVNVQNEIINTLTFQSKINKRRNTRSELTITMSPRALSRHPQTIEVNSILFLSL